MNVTYVLKSSPLFLTVSLLQPSSTWPRWWALPCPWWVSTRPRTGSLSLTWCWQKWTRQQRTKLTLPRDPPPYSHPRYSDTQAHQTQGACVSLVSLVLLKGNSGIFEPGPHYLTFLCLSDSGEHQLGNWFSILQQTTTVTSGCSCTGEFGESYNITETHDQESRAFFPCLPLVRVFVCPSLATKSLILKSHER